MMHLVEPFITANLNIDPNGHCSLNCSHVLLPLKANHVPAYRRQYDIPCVYHEAVEVQIHKWIEDNVIENAPPNTPYNSPLLVVRKKNPDGDYTGDIRVVTDYRLVNQALDPSKLDRYPLPLISDIHQRLSADQLYTTIDLSQCFHSFLIEKKYRPLTCFTYKNKRMVFRKCPFGITHISSHTQRILTDLFNDLPYVTVFVDDITIHTNNDMTYHTTCIQTVLDRLTKAHLKINADKLHIAQTCIYILGFCISAQHGLLLDQRKVSNILDWPTTVNSCKELQSRLGVANFFRSHIPNMSTLTAPLDCLRNETNIQKVWTTEHSAALKKLQFALANAPVLSVPNLKYEFCVVTDASAFGISACLYQVIKNKIYYMGFAARSLTPSERKWGSSKRELLAVVYAFTKYRKWLLGRHFNLFVDNKALLYLHSQEKINRMIENWYETIFELDYTVNYCSGIRNILADRLSRLFISDASTKLEGGNIGIKKTPITKKAKTIKEQTNNLNNNSSTSSTTYHKMKQDLTICASHLDTYRLPTSDDEKKDILEKTHLFGHHGIIAMERLIHNDYKVHWPNLRKDISNYINSCNECRQFNLGKHVYHPPRSITPNNVWDHIVFDLGSFSITTPRGNNFILVLVDLFSRFTIVRPLQNKSAITVAKELVDIFSLFGYPKIISHDNGKEFSNDLLRKIIELSGIEQRVILPYNPRANGANESMVGNIKRIIIKSLKGKSDSWDLYLGSAMLSANLTYARLHKNKPFNVMFHRQANEFADYTHQRETLRSTKIDIDALNQKLEDINNIIIPAIKEQIIKTQKADNDYFSKKHRILTNPFPIGAEVMIKSVEKNLTSTEPKYEGPFRIQGYTKHGSYILVDKTNAFLTRDVPTSQIKLISDDAVQPDNEHFEVQAIIDHRGTEPNYEYKVRWKGYGPEDDTWQEPDTFDSQVPIRQYWQRRNANTGSIKIPTFNKRKIPSRNDKVQSRKKSRR